MKLRHNKRRNTAFIYEALIRQLTKASIEDKDRDKEKKQIFNILKEFFNKDSILKKELELYRALYQTKNINKAQAEKIISEVKRVYFGLNQKEVFDTQSRLVSKINKTTGAKVFANFVPHYKYIAAINQMFNEKTPIKNKILMEQEIIQYMAKPLKEQKDFKIKNSVYKLFTKKFNLTYKDLYQEQKELLSKFVSSFQDDGLELKIFLNEEIGRLKKAITKSSSTKGVKEDSRMVDRLNELNEKLDSFKGQYITKNVLINVLKVQDLVREIKK
jgi:hypothetical protein